MAATAQLLSDGALRRFVRDGYVTGQTGARGSACTRTPSTSPATGSPRTTPRYMVTFEFGRMDEPQPDGGSETDGAWPAERTPGAPLGGLWSSRCGGPPWTP
jgi:hypothetical protein